MIKRLLMCTALLCASVPMLAQQMPPMSPQGPKGPPASPKAQATATIGGKAITIDYSSPRVRGRAGKIYTKDGLIGHEKNYPIWRAGADEATTLKTQGNLMIGDLMVPAGTYTLFVDVSDPAQWTLVVSKATGEWGLDYDKTKDLGRVKMKMTKSAALVENLAWTIKDQGGNRGTITLEWENEGASVSVTVH